ncbi:unnamed protein product [Camellia sinensis]
MQQKFEREFNSSCSVDSQCWKGPVQLRWVMMFYNFPQMYWISQSGKAVVIDSGTTLAYLADDMFTPLMEKLWAHNPI